MKWKDSILNWDPQWTPGAYVVYLDPLWPWTPEISLYNSVGLFQNQISDADVILYYDGTVTWSRTIDFSYLCPFNLNQFPFDSQSCNAKFGSFRDSGSVTDFHLGPHTEPFQLNKLQSPSWHIDAVTSFRTVEYDSYGSIPFLNWTIKMTRFSSFYVTTIIAPCILIAYLSLVTLWINDLSSRMILSILAVLTIVVLTWSLVFSLPVTQNVTWIQNFCFSWSFFVVLICVESTIASYMLMKKGDAPCFIEYLVIFSTPRKFYAFVTGSTYKSRATQKTTRIDESKGDDKNKRTDIEMVAAIDNSAAVNVLHAEDSDDDDANDPQWHYISPTEKLLMPADRRASLVETEKSKASWIKGARALDRLSRTFFALAFVILNISFFVTRY